MSAFRHDLHNIYCVRPSKVQMWSIGTCIFKWSYRFRRELSLTIDINHMMFVFRFLLPRCSIIFSRSWSNVSPQTTKDFLFDIFLALNFETLSNPVKFCPEIVGARVNEMIFCNVSICLWCRLLTMLARFSYKALGCVKKIAHFLQAICCRYPKVVQLTAEKLISDRMLS